MGGGVADLPEAAFKLLTRIIGAHAGRGAAHMGARVTGQGGKIGTGESLIASNAGATAMQQVLLRLPKMERLKIVTGALRGDPLPDSNEAYSLANALLEAPANPKMALHLAQQLHAYAWMSMVNAVADDSGEDEE